MIIIHELGEIPFAGRRSQAWDAWAEVKGSAEDLHQKEDTFVAGRVGGIMISRAKIMEDWTTSQSYKKTTG